MPGLDAWLQGLHLTPVHAEGSPLLGRFSLLIHLFLLELKKLSNSKSKKYDHSIGRHVYTRVCAYKCMCVCVREKDFKPAET